MNELALFAGAGGGLLASRLLGWNTIGAVEIAPYPRDRLLQRQRDGMLDHFPVWDDVCTFDGRPWRGLVDVISGGFPCQDISAAGRGGGLAGSRSGLWFEYLRIIGEVRPQFVFSENSPLLRTRGLNVVLQGLASVGYDATWGVLGAWHVGAYHKRNRMWVVANAEGVRCGQGRAWRSAAMCKGKQEQALQDATDASSIGQQGQGAYRDASYPTTAKEREATQPQHGCFGEIWGTEPRLDRVVHGVADRVDRIKAIGNGQVPLVAATAWDILRGNA